MTFEVEEGTKTPATRLAEQIGMRKISRRQGIWLWLCLYIQERAELLPESCGGYTMEEEILSVLERSPHLRRKDIQWEMDAQLLPDEQFSWVTEDERQICWLQDYLPRKRWGFPGRLMHLTGRELLIARLDTWDADLAEKAELAEDLQRRWNEHAARDSDFEWFLDAKDGKARCRYAGKWLAENYPTFGGGAGRVDSYQSLVMFFDRERLEPKKQQKVIKGIKGAWSRRQYDERNAGSKQLNVVVPLEVLSQLDQLVKEHGMSRAKIVAKLIDREKELGLYLAE